MKLSKIIKTLAVVGSACIGLAEVLKRIGNLGILDEFSEERPTKDVNFKSEVNTENRN